MTDEAPARDQLKTTFGNVALEYQRGRPRYDDATTAAILAGLPSSPIAVDLGAGSGQLALPLADAGAHVVAVEPLAPAGAVLAAAVAARGSDRRGRVDVLAGAAEAIPVADGQADLVTCADSFHWFDAPAAVDEIVRVLRPGGRCCVSQLLPEWSAEQSGAWAAEVGDLVIPIWLAARHPHNDGTDPDALVHPALDPVEVVDLAIVHRSDRAGLLDYFCSVSVVAVLPDDERAAFREAVAAVLDRHDVGAVDLDYRARLWLTTRR